MSGSRTVRVPHGHSGVVGAYIVMVPLHFYV